MKLKLRGMKIKSTQDLEVTLKRMWRQFSDDYADNLGQSMEKRREAIIRS